MAELRRRAGALRDVGARIRTLARESGIGRERAGILAAEIEAERTDVAGHQQRALARPSDSLAALGKMAVDAAAGDDSRLTLAVMRDARMTAAALERAVCAAVAAMQQRAVDADEAPLAIDVGLVDWEPRASGFHAAAAERVHG